MEPIKWEKIPTDSSATIGLESYRTLIDGKGWIYALVVPNREPEFRQVAVTFVPDENEMWGK